MINIKNLGSYLIWSEDPFKLGKWYEEMLGLVREEVLEYPDDTGILYNIGGRYFWIGKHDKVHGVNQDPYRHMINFIVDDVKATYEELKGKGVTFIAKPFISPGKDMEFATFQDPEGNILQIMRNF